MKSAAAVIGFFGSIGAFLLVLFFLLIVSGLGSKRGEPPTESNPFTYLAFLMPLIGISASIVCTARPKIGGLLMILSGLGAPIAIHWWGIYDCPECNNYFSFVDLLQPVFAVPALIVLAGILSLSAGYLKRAK